MEAGWIVLVFGLPVLLSAWATVKVAGDEFSERGQKWSQLALFWLLPMLGALLVLGVHRKTEQPSRIYRKDPDSGEDFTASGNGIRRTLDALDDD